MALWMELIFPMYPIEKFKNLLLINQWTDFNITWQECFFGYPLPRIFKLLRFRQKNGCQVASYFPLYIYIENLKIILVRNHWTDFSITWQKCSFGDPLPRLFKLSCYFKKYGGYGAELIFLLYLYRKLQKSSCQTPLGRFQYNLEGVLLL